MKKIIKLTLITIILGFATTIQAQTCLPSGIILNSQSQIDNFAINYPGCTEILGPVVIQSSNINNLNGLSQLTLINSNLRISYSHNLTNFTGLNNLQSVATTLNIQSNNSLTSLEGLDGLTNVGSLYINNNENLESFNGLNNLTTVSSQIQIHNNYSITSFQGFDSLESANSIFIENNPSLINFSGLNNLTSIGYNIYIAGCNSLESLHGLESLTSIERVSLNNNNQLSDINALENINPGILEQISIHHNPSLSFCAINSLCQYITSPDPTGFIHNNATGCNNETEIYLMCNSISCLVGGITFSNQSEIDNFLIDYPDCTQIGGDVIIQNSTDITNLDGLANIAFIGGSLIIDNNTSLVVLSDSDDFQPDFIINGLSNLTSITNNLIIKDNSNLSDLNGLSTLSFVGGIINIEGNTSLASLAGLNNINESSFNNLLITNNNSLSLCEVESICNYLNVSSNSATINNNGQGCNSRPEVETACENLSTEDHSTITVTLYPNPTEGVLYINGVTEGKISIYDTTGRFIKEQTFTPEINLSNLQNGLYFIVLEYEGGSFVNSIVKK